MLLIPGIVSSLQIVQRKEREGEQQQRRYHAVISAWIFHEDLIRSEFMPSHQHSTQDLVGALQIFVVSNVIMLSL